MILRGDHQFITHGEHGASVKVSIELPDYLKTQDIIKNIYAEEGKILLWLKGDTEITREDETSEDIKSIIEELDRIIAYAMQRMKSPEDQKRLRDYLHLTMTITEECYEKTFGDSLDGSGAIKKGDKA